MQTADARGLAADDPREAEAAFATAAEHADRAIAANPAEVGMRYWRALMRLQTASRQRDRGDTAAARVSLDQARAEYDALGAEQGWPAGIRQRAATCENLAGLMDTDDGHDPDAIARLTRAVALRRELVARNPDSLDLRAELATSLSNLGRALLLAGRLRDAAGPAREGVALGEDVYAADPGREHARFYAGRFRTRAGLVAAVLGEWDRAVADLTAAGRLTAGPVPPAFRQHAAEAAVWLGLVECGRGRWRAAVAAWAGAARLTPPTPASGG